MEVFFSEDGQLTENLENLIRKSEKLASRLANIKAQMKKDIVNFTHEQALQVRSLIETCLEQHWRKLIIDREKIGIINEKSCLPAVWIEPMEIESKCIYRVMLSARMILSPRIEEILLEEEGAREFRVRGNSLSRIPEEMTGLNQELGALSLGPNMVVNFWQTPFAEADGICVGDGFISERGWYVLV